MRVRTSSRRAASAGAVAPERAASPSTDCFDFSKGPRAFVKISAPYPPSFFMHELPDDYFAPDYE